MSRSLKKGPYVDVRLADKVEDMRSRNDKKVIKTWARASTIAPDFIESIQVDQGPVMKRVLPAPQGRAYRIRKRMCHLTIVVGTK